MIAAYYLKAFIRLGFSQRMEIFNRHMHLDSLMHEMKFELNLAKKIQPRLLPVIYPNIKGLQFAAMYKPMEELGGDFYDFIRFAEPNLIGILISDVSGHGIPAALITSMLKTLTITSGIKKFTPPEFLTYMNSHLIGQIGDNFLTAIYMIYDSDKRIIRFSRAGHPYQVEIIISTIYQRLIVYKGDEKFHDDICLVGIEIT